MLQGINNIAPINPLTAEIDPDARLDLIAALDLPDVIPSDVIPPSPIPLPASVWLFGAGLVGLWGFVRKKHNT